MNVQNLMTAVGDVKGCNTFIKKVLSLVEGILVHLPYFTRTSRFLDRLHVLAECKR